MSSGKVEHYQYRDCLRESKCSFKFDGSGDVLAHVFSPIGEFCREIDLDKSEDLHFGFDSNMPEYNIDLL